MPTNAISVDNIKFKANNVWNGLDEVRLYNGTNALYCKEGVTTGLLMRDNQIQVVAVTWNPSTPGVPTVGDIKGYIDSAGDYHYTGNGTSANATSLNSLRESVVPKIDASVAQIRYYPESEGVSLEVQGSDNIWRSATFLFRSNRIAMFKSGQTLGFIDISLPAITVRIYMAYTNRIGDCAGWRLDNITANNIANYSFSHWGSLSTNGWVGSCYIENPLSSSSSVWCAWGTANDATNQILCPAIYVLSK